MLIHDSFRYLGDGRAVNKYYDLQWKAGTLAVLRPKPEALEAARNGGAPRGNRRLPNATRWVWEPRRCSHAPGRA